MDPSDVTLQNINQILKAGIAGQALSFGHMLSCAMGDKLSVIAAYAPEALGPDYYRLDSRGEAERCTDFSGYYYGISPLLDSEQILTALANGQFSTLPGLDEFILAHHDCFMCRPEQREQLLHLARYGVLALASNYGIRVRSTPALEALCRRLDPGGVILRFPGDGLLHVRGCPTQDWHCCGLVLSGTRPDDEKPGRKASVPDYSPAQRRMHFNIIFQLDSSRTFPQLRESCTQAAESFENEQLRGVRLTCCRGPRELRQNRFFSLCRRVVDSRDLVESLLLIVLAFSGPGLGFSDGLSLIFALLVVLLTARRIWQAARELQRLRRAVTPMLLFQSDGADRLKAQLDRLFRPGDKSLSFHPATYACLTLYLCRCHSGLSEKTP